MNTKVVRAKLTDAEWQRAREKALRQQIPVAEFVGRAIRAALAGRTS